MGFIMISAIEQKSYFILLYACLNYVLHLADLYLIHLGEVWKDPMSLKPSCISKKGLKLSDIMPCLP